MASKKKDTTLTGGEQAPEVRKRGRPKKAEAKTDKKPTVKKKTKPARDMIPIGDRSVGNPNWSGGRVDIDSSDNTKYLMQGLRIANLPKIDLHDPEQVQNRVNEYYTIVAENDMKPTVAGLANALGMDRQTLWEIRSGHYRFGKVPYGIPEGSSDRIKKAYKIMEELWENYMQNGKINPVSGIFLGKNHFGYQDKQDIVVTPKQPENDFNAADIASRYMIEEDTPDGSDN